MLNIHKLVIDPFVTELKTAYEETYGGVDPDLANIIGWTGHLALENIANCDALYHNVEHTIMVTLCGQEILRGKHLSEGGVRPEDWLHFIMACLCHDIGFVKGICRKDSHGVYDTGVGGKTVTIPPGGTDAALTPYHIDRGKLFILERFGGKSLLHINAELIASLIEMTRFPIPDDEFHKDTGSYAGLVRGADLIGQLGDPNYLRKIPALFYEFEEMGTNKMIGYKNAEDMRKSYAKFFWGVVHPYIQDALSYLRVTQEGKQWISNLHSHVFTIEHTQDGRSQLSPGVQFM
ncbi:MAG: metal-dependent phosphohydrolase [Desulfobacterales bacterium]|nr:metal-dependent phosphohydrolase [Desulfobacterales bacterium]